MNRPARPVMTTERQTTRNGITPAANEDDAATPGQSGMATLGRAFSILSTLHPGDYALTLAKLAVRIRLYKSTILRLAGSLIQHRILFRLEDGHYQIGATPLILDVLYQRSMRLSDVALPYIHALAEATNEAVSLCIRGRDMRVYLYHANSNHSIHDHVREGDVLSLERGSGGHVLRAFSGMQGTTYDVIRRDHYYVSIGEHGRETVGLSVLVLGAQQALWGTLCLVGLASRIDEALLQLWHVPALEHAAQITSTLGGDPAPLRLAAQLISKTQASPRHPTP